MIERFDFIVEEESELTKEQVYESETIINRIGLTGEFKHMHFAMFDGDDIILKLDEKDMGNILTILIKQNSHFSKFGIKYEETEKYASVGIDGVNCLYTGVANEVEVLRIKGMKFLFR